MEITVAGGLHNIRFDLILTLALAALVLFTGSFLQRRVRLLSRSNIPAPVIGGLLFALIVFVLHARGLLGVSIDPVLRNPLQIAFFTTIGLGATLSLLRSGGRSMILFGLIVAGTAVLQNVVGIAVARVVGAPDVLGIICGSVTLTGGPATGLAFTETFEQMGITGAGALIIASATFGICVASIVGNPVATALIRRFNLASPREMTATGAVDVQDTSNAGLGEQRDVIIEAKSNEDVRHYSLTGNILLQNLLVLLAVMGVGTLINAWHTRLGVILPNFTGPIVVAAVVRNVDDRYGWFKLNVRAVEVLGAIALPLFLAVALMDLKLWQLAELAVPMLTILAVQVVITVAYAVCGTFVLMGRDYEAAVAMTGHIGFGVGIASNAVANMEALIARYGPAPRSFVTVPVMALLSIDFLNPLIIVLFANLVR